MNPLALFADIQPAVTGGNETDWYTPVATIVRTMLWIWLIWWALKKFSGVKGSELTIDAFLRRVPIKRNPARRELRNGFAIPNALNIKMFFHNLRPSEFICG
jgi:hypothetical protein